MPTALIVGAGIGGLSAALALRRRGWDVQVFERASSPRELGFALALAPNAMAALRELGVAGPVIRDGFMTRSIEICRGDGTLLKRMDFDVEHGAVYSVVALRTVVHGSLVDAVGSDVLVLDSPAAGFDLTVDGVSVRLADGRRIDGQILVGADGVASVIRRQLHPGEPDPRPSGFHAIRGVTHGAADRLGGASGILYLGDGIEGGLARANADDVYWYLSLLDADVEAGTADPWAVMERAARSLDPRFASIALAARPQDLRLDRLFQRDPLEKWGDGPVTLLGDAAHPVLPYTAQGAALALEDAVALGLALARGGDPVPALRRYERVRSGRTRRTVRVGPRIGAMTTTVFPSRGADGARHHRPLRQAAAIPFSPSFASFTKRQVRRGRSTKPRGMAGPSRSTRRTIVSPSQWCFCFRGRAVFPHSLLQPTVASTRRVCFRMSSLSNRSVCTLRWSRSRASRR